MYGGLGAWAQVPRLATGNPGITGEQMRTSQEEFRSTEISISFLLTGSILSTESSLDWDLRQESFT